MHAWGGKLHRLPFRYVLTGRATVDRARKKRTAKQAYARWFFPCRREKLPPLRLCRGSDFSLSTQRSRFFDWKKLCDRIQFYLVEKNGVFTPPENESEAMRQFDEAMDVHYDTYVRAFHPSARKRKRKLKKCTAAVSTVVEEMRLMEHQVKRIKWLLKGWEALIKLQRLWRQR